ncbi:MAG: hypothetical protein NC400_07870 [Clostridium sp.]|nr:hypothetical protein [Clostridium sp.]
MEEKIVKHTVKDSVFSDLFRIKKYLLQLYLALHPEDIAATEDELTDITIKNVLTDNLYNDLGFLLGDRLMILVEAQSTWTANIIIRGLMYLVQTYHDYFERTNQNLYRSKKVKIPKPELYVIYTGDRGEKEDTISLSKEFFEGMDIAIDVRVKIIYESNTDDIINQYIIFSKVYDEQRKLYGRTKTAITETIRICKDKNILKEYLESREKEVVSIMMSLFDEEEVMRSYIRSERYEAGQNKIREKAKLMLEKGKITIDEMSVFFPELSGEEIKEIEAEVMQLA